MDDLIHDLSPGAKVLDLGAGKGSFHYASTSAQIIAMDVTSSSGAQACFAQVRARSESIPLTDSSIDVAICNHSLEHFENLESALLELNRVIKPGGHLWAAIPDGFSFDDNLYRFIFHGGGHVNRFSLRLFVQTIESKTQLRVLRYKKLFSGFVYLNPPDCKKLIDYPKRARFLARVPRPLLEAILRWMNYFVRLADRCLGSSLSHYGWGIVFRCLDPTRCPGPSNLDQLEVIPSDINVCFSCGAGHPAATLLPKLNRFLFWKIYECGNCGKENLFVQ